MRNFKDIKMTTHGDKIEDNLEINIGVAANLKLDNEIDVELEKHNITIDFMSSKPIGEISEEVERIIEKYQFKGYKVDHVRITQEFASKIYGKCRDCTIFYSKSKVGDNYEYKVVTHEESEDVKILKQKTEMKKRRQTLNEIKAEVLKRGNRSKHIIDDAVADNENSDDLLGYVYELIVGSGENEQ